MSQKPTTDEIPPEVLELHPIVLVLAGELQKGEGEEEFAPLAEDRFIELGAAILHYVDEENPKVELLHIVQSLACYAYVLRETHKSPALAEQIVTCIAQDEVVANVDKLKVSADPETVRQVAERFGNFSGSKTDKTAPKVGEAKPEGSLDINALNFPKRM